MSVIVVAFGVHMVLMAAMMLWLPGQGEVYGAILLAACWGIGDGILGTLTISKWHADIMYGPRSV